MHDTGHTVVEWHGIEIWTPTTNHTAGKWKDACITSHTAWKVLAMEFFHGFLKAHFSLKEITSALEPSPKILVLGIWCSIQKYWVLGFLKGVKSWVLHHSEWITVIRREFLIQGWIRSSHSHFLALKCYSVHCQGMVQYEDLSYSHPHDHSSHQECKTWILLL